VPVRAWTETVDEEEDMKRSLLLGVLIFVFLFLSSISQPIAYNGLTYNAAGANEIICSCGATCIEEADPLPGYDCDGTCFGGTGSECRACMDECCPAACRAEGCSYCSLDQ
jgi:hypothetical protein